MPRKASETDYRLAALLAAGVAFNDACSTVGIAPDDGKRLLGHKRFVALLERERQTVLERVCCRITSLAEVALDAVGEVLRGKAKAGANAKLAAAKLILERLDRQELVKVQRRLEDLKRAKSRSTRGRGGAARAAAGEAEAGADPGTVAAQPEQTADDGGQGHPLRLAAGFAADGA